MKSLLKLLIVLLVASNSGCSRPSGALDQKDLAAAYQELSAAHLSAVEGAPLDEAIRGQAAQFFYNFRDYKQAAQLLGTSEDIGSRILLAKTLAHLKGYNKALEVFEQVVSAHTNKEKAVAVDQINLSGLEAEFVYLYAQVLEEKNLFPKALAVYRQVSGEHAPAARKRIGEIKAKIEFGVPAEIESLLKNAASFIEQSSDEAAVMLLVDEQTDIRADKTSLSSIHVVKQILQERGKGLAEVDIGYDSTYQRVTLEYARTITADGKVIYAGNESIRDVSRYLNYPLYSNSRAFIISMPSVDKGSIIEYKLNIHSAKLINEDDFSFAYRLRERLPIYQARFRLITPRSTPAKFKFFNLDYAPNHDLQPLTREGDDSIIHDWEFKEIKPIIPEYAMPPAAEINPAFMVSSFKDWDEVYQWWKRLYQDKLVINDEIKEFTAKLIAASGDDFEKAQAIYEFVAKDIRYVAIEYGDSGHEPHHAEEVFANRYGDCKDQAILLVAMMRHAGLKAYPVLIPTRQAYGIDKDFATAYFNHAIASVELEGELIFMDPTSSTNPFGEVPLSDQDRTVLVFFDQAFQITEVPHNAANTINYNMDIIIDEDENASIKRTIETQGFFASRYRYYLKYTHPELIKEDILRKMTQISSLSKLKDHSIENADNFAGDPRLSYSFSAEKFLTPARTLRIIPGLDPIDLDHNIIGKEAREFPLDFDGINVKTARVSITLPKNLEVKYLPESKVLDNPWFRLAITYNLAEGRVIFDQSFSIKQRFVEPNSYQEFKNYFKQALYLSREEVILEKQ